MKHIWLGTLMLALIALGAGLPTPPQAARAEPPCCPPPEDCFLKRLKPVGGWCPYGCFLHWWPCHCFPCGGAPDDYCHKPLPRVCWPPYPPYFIWGPPEICYPQPGCAEKK
jgi:hypothetical protein